MINYLSISRKIMGITNGTLKQQQLDKMRQTHSTLNRIRSDLDKMKVDVSPPI